MKIAFFDFDGTLTRHDTFIKFAKFSVGKASFYRAILLSLPDLCLWKLGMKSNSEAKQSLFKRLYRGMEYVRFKRLGKAFISKIERDLNLDVVDEMNRHMIEGHMIIIVSASIDEWIRPWAARRGVDDIIATKVEIDASGCLTGRFSTPNCHGKEKVRRINEFVKNLDECETWGYGDSSGDDAMLATVDHPNRV